LTRKRRGPSKQGGNVLSLRREKDENGLFADG